MHKCKVSVVIPVFNIEEYVIECLDSISNQTIEDVEIIIIDDGSADNSLEIVNRYAIGRNNIQILSGKNEGLSAARNKGLKLAQGKYVYFCDGDDYIRNDTLEKCYKAACDDNLDVVVFQSNIFGDIDEQDRNQYHFSDLFNYDNPFVVDGITHFKDTYKVYPLINTPMMFFRREFLLKNNLFFSKGLLHEDLLFYYSLLKKNPKMCFLKANFYNRRYRHNSIMTVGIQKKNIDSYAYIYYKMMDDLPDELEKEYEYISLHGFLSCLNMAEKNGIDCKGKTAEYIDAYFAENNHLISKSMLNMYYCHLVYSKLSVLTELDFDVHTRILEKMKTLLQNLGLYAQRTIGVYGTGAFSLSFLNTIEELFGPFEAELKYIDSSVKSGEKAYRNGTVFNVDEVDYSNVEKIIILSEKFEDEIKNELIKRGLEDKVIGISTWGSQ